MISSQLGRTLLSRRALSADQQDAVPDEAGSYGELMDVIDRILEPAEPEADDGSPDGGSPFGGTCLSSLAGVDDTQEGPMGSGSLSGREEVVWPSL